VPMMGFEIIKTQSEQASAIGVGAKRF